MIEKITNNLENFHYNVIIANLHEIYRFYKKKVEEPIKKEFFLLNYKNIIKMMIPIIPHFANECLEQLNTKEDISWPRPKKDLLEKIEYKIVVQINGKKRELLISGKELSEKELLTSIKKNEKCFKYLEKKEIKKVIYVKNKLIKIII